MPDPTDRRLHPRRSTVRAASILIDDGPKEIPCVVLDRSESGFLLHVHLIDEVPKRFRIRLSSEDGEFHCETVWRTDNKIGVKFTSAG